MIVTVPNFGRAQFLLHSIIDYKNLKRHNTSIMKLKAFRNALEKLPFKIEMLRYYQTFGFWHENKNPGKLTRFFNNLIWKAGDGMIKLFGDDWSNSMFSPHIVCVARRWMT